MRRIIRVFPRKTSATPDDALAVVGRGPDLFEEADEVHISVTFTWDLPFAEKLAEAWTAVAPVRIGGPATGAPAGEFIPGLYLRHGWTITSRGCPNHCAHCLVPERQGNLQTLPIRPGHIVQDDNLLACPEHHIKEVFAMLRRQKEPADLRGLEAKLLLPWHIDLFHSIRISQLWFAYDEPADLPPLIMAGEMLNAAGFDCINKKARAYVLCGYDGDTLEAAEYRMLETIRAGFVPFAMLWKNKDGSSAEGWGAFQREWTRPAAMWEKLKRHRRPR